MNPAHEQYFNAMAEQARRQSDVDFQQGQVLAGQKYRQNILNHALEMSPGAQNAALGFDPTAAAKNLAEAGRATAEAGEATQRGGYYGSMGRQTTALTPGMGYEAMGRGALGYGGAAEGFARQRMIDAGNPLMTPGLNFLPTPAGYPSGFNEGASDVQNYKKGKTKVPGKGPSNQDTVPSNLAPGEAVLNTEAADHLGRGAIQLLNAIGLAKRQLAQSQGGGVGAAQGQDPGAAAGNQEGSPVPGYADGTPMAAYGSTSDLVMGDRMARGYADGTSFTQRINQMPGTGGSSGGTWGPSGDTPAAPNSGQVLRAGLGIQGAQRPNAPPLPQPQVKGPLGFNKGTTDVPATRKEAAREAAETKRAGPALFGGTGTQGGGKGSRGGEDQKDKTAQPGGKGQVQKHNDAEPNRMEHAAKGKAVVGKKGAPPSHDHVHPDGHVTIHPDVLRSLLTMGGGGMPTPGSTQPLPMPMPMAAGVGQTPPQMGGNATRLPMQGGGQ